MPRITYNDNTYFKHTKADKARWKKAAKIEKAKDLSAWMRDALNNEATVILAVERLDE